MGLKKNIAALHSMLEEKDLKKYVFKIDGAIAYLNQGNGFYLIYDYTNGSENADVRTQELPEIGPGDLEGEFSDEPAPESDSSLWEYDFSKIIDQDFREAELRWQKDLQPEAE